MNKFIICLTTLLLPFTGFAESNKNQMVADLETIKTILKTDYAPKEWKKNHLNWDIDTETDKIKKAISSSSSITVRQFQRYLSAFFHSMRDHHCGIRFFSTENATLPFTVKGVDGHYYVNYIDKTCFSPSIYNLNIGDELIFFDGKPTHDAVLNLQATEFMNTDEGTYRSCAEIFLTRRDGSRGFFVPKGPISVTVKPLFSNKTSTFQLIWQYTPEKVTNHLDCNVSNETQTFTQKLFKKEFVTSFFDKKEVGTKNPHMLGAKKSFIPDLGRKWWEIEESNPTTPLEILLENLGLTKSNPFYAYLYETEDKKLIGYIRIPHYSMDPSSLKNFAEILEFFEERSDALVIDQVNNPGGSVFYLYTLASMLTNQSLYTPKHRMSITQQDVMLALEMIPLLENVTNDAEAEELFDDFEGITVSHQFVQFILNFFRFTVEEWNAGRSLTNPSYLFGIDHINPHPDCRYTKPILILVNELDFSGGDFFPAIMQDNKRAKIMGCRTAGAGGYVTSASFPNLSGIAAFHYTASIAERVDLKPIENLGVTPDIPYSISKIDLQHGYLEYVDAINAAVHELLNP